MSEPKIVADPRSRPEKRTCQYCGRWSRRNYSVINHRSLCPLVDVRPVEEAEELLDDPTTPFWVREIIRMALKKDCVDVANALQVLADVFERRADKILHNGG